MKHSWKWPVVLCVCALLITHTAHPQQVDHYTPSELIARAQQLQAKAMTSNGSAAETLQKYGVDYTMLSFRSKDGGGELHEKNADIFVILDGSATLLTGGELVDPKPSAPGEMQGASVLHAVATHLAKGDIVHIPANTPHQMLMEKGGTVTYFVIKVKEKD